MDAILKKLARHILRNELRDLKNALLSSETDRNFYRNSATRWRYRFEAAAAELSLYREVKEEGPVKAGGTD